MKRLPLSLVFALALAGSLGCSSGTDSREDVALKRLRDRPLPGYVRVVNLTESPIVATKNARPIMASVDPDRSSKLVAFAAGKGTIEVGARKVEIDLKSGEGTSVVVYPAGKPDQIGGEIRRPAEANVKVYFVPGDGSAPVPSSGIAVSGPTAATIDARTRSLLLAAGSYKVGGEKVKVESKFAYTFLFVPSKGKLRPFLMLNTPNERPTGVGASSS